jgi:hypothetical protein
MTVDDFITSARALRLRGGGSLPFEIYETLRANGWGTFDTLEKTSDAELIGLFKATLRPYRGRMRGALSAPHCALKIVHHALRAARPLARRCVQHTWTEWRSFLLLKNERIAFAPNDPIHRERVCLACGKQENFGRSFTLAEARSVEMIGRNYREAIEGR